MPDIDQLSDSDELAELRDSLSHLALPARPRVETITARGRARRRHRRVAVARLSVVGAVGVTALALVLTGVQRPASRLGTIRTTSFTLHRNANGTDSLTLNPGELLQPAQLQSDLEKYGIPAKVTTGSFCSSDPAPAGFSQVWRGPGPGTWQGQGAPGEQPPPTITIDGSAMPAGTELSIANFQLTSGQYAGSQEAYAVLMNANSYTCTSTPPSPDSAAGDNAASLTYGGPGPSS